MQPEKSLNDLREKLRELRERSLGSYEKAALAMGFNKNTVASYEKGQSLPDIDFLFVFADRTGTDINELIRLRLACSKYESVRALTGSAQVEKPERLAETQKQSASDVSGSPEIDGDGGRGILEAALRVGEYKIKNNQVTPQVIDFCLQAGPNWIKAASAFPDLDLRMRNMVATFAFLNAAGVA